MSDSLAFTYTFTHKSGRKIIAQTSTEFYHMQGHPSKNVPEYLKNKDGKFENNIWSSNYNRLGFNPWRGNAGTLQYQSEEKLNKIWNACKGYERLFNSFNDKHHSRLHTGYFGCPLRRFIAELSNISIMLGDKDLYNKSHKDLLTFNNNMLLLPPPSNNN